MATAVSSRQPSDPERAELLGRLVEELGAGLVDAEPDTRFHFGRDWTRVHAPDPLAVLFPRSTEEVSRSLQACSRLELAVVPSGGRTGLAAGAVAARGEVVLSLTRMGWLEPVEPMGATVEVGAGATTDSVHRHCRPWGLVWPIDLAARGSSTVGGNLATNAGGVRVVRYGHARHWVTGLVAVRMDGEVLRLRGALHKDNTGPDLCQLLIGSEGTLAVITEATLKLTRAPGPSWVVLFAVEDPGAALRLLESARLRGNFSILALEYFAEPCLEAVLRVRTGLRAPFARPSAGYVLLECEPGSDPADTERWLESTLEEGLATDAVLGQSAADRARLWSYRENITESLGHLGLMHKNDVSVPVPRTGDLIRQLEREPNPYPGRLFLFGHLGDGNLHVNVMKPEGMDSEQFWEECRIADRRVYALLQELGGSVSAEHGIGLLKREALHWSRSPAEIELLRALKHSFDPQGLLNPGKLIPTAPP